MDIFFSLVNQDDRDDIDGQDKDLVDSVELDTNEQIETIEPTSDPVYDYQLDIDCDDMPITIDELTANNNSDTKTEMGKLFQMKFDHSKSKKKIIPVLSVLILGHHSDMHSDIANQCLINDHIIEANVMDDDSKSNSNGIYEQQSLSHTLNDLKTNNLCSDSGSSPHIQWNFDAHKIDEEGSNLLIGSSLTICDESSDDHSADTAVEEIEPTIQNLELDQKFNDAESYLIESGEISGDGGGK